MIQNSHDAETDFTAHIVRIELVVFEEKEATAKKPHLNKLKRLKRNNLIESNLYTNGSMN